MKRLLPILTLASLASISAQAADKARTSFDAGLQAFAASNYPAASNAFLEAGAAAPAEKLDPAAAYYNAGLAAYAGGDLKAAADSFARAASASDLALQSQAYYNRGNALFHQVGSPDATMQAAAMPMPSMSTQELADAESSVAEAIQMYENAIALDPKDADAKANYELAVLMMQKLQQDQNSKVPPQNAGYVKLEDIASDVKNATLSNFPNRVEFRLSDKEESQP